GQDAQQAGLAAAVRPAYLQHVAAAQLQAHAAEQASLAAHTAQVLRGENRRGLGPRPGLHVRLPGHVAAQCDVPSAYAILLPTLYLPEGLFMGMRLISSRVWLS